MERCLLSIDWDYFIYTQKENWGSYIESRKSLIDLWYQRYIQEKARGRDIRQFYRLSSEADRFWETLKQAFEFKKDIKVYVSDSHALSYNIAKDTGCNVVYLFDSHADLGYGGLSSLDFEVNCSNWLGKLLKEGLIHRANIFYSPYTAENPEDFKAMNRIYNIRYSNALNESDQALRISAIHICRSGAWTPPWLDEKFTLFINALGVPYTMTDCPERKWDTENISLADQINYLMA